MPCGGIHPISNNAGTRAADSSSPCWQCGEKGGDCYLEEWDATIHSKCVEDFLHSDEGAVVLLHGHEVSVWDEDGHSINTLYPACEPPRPPSGLDTMLETAFPEEK